MGLNERCFLSRSDFVKDFHIPLSKLLTSQINFQGLNVRLVDFTRPILTKIVGKYFDPRSVVLLSFLLRVRQLIPPSQSHQFEVKLGRFQLNISHKKRQSFPKKDTKHAILKRLDSNIKKRKQLSCLMEKRSEVTNLNLEAKYPFE